MDNVKSHWCNRHEFLERIVVGVALLTPLQAADHKSATVLLCGKERVFEAAIEQKSEGKAALRTVWTWTAAKSEGLPQELVPKFRSTDDCKPVSGGREILISSSGGAVALVSRSSGKTLFYANVTSAHSAELLPGGWIVAAASTSNTNTGDRLLLFRREVPDKPVDSLPLPSGHGVQWDATRNRLWALGFDQLLEINAQHKDKESGSLKVVKRHPLPSKGGHDLRMTHDGKYLLVTTESQALQFDLKTSSFSDFAPLAGEKNIKSVSIDPAINRLVYTQADKGEWWTYTLRFKNPDATISMPEYIYKVRWYIPHP